MLFNINAMKCGNWSEISLIGRIKSIDFLRKKKEELFQFEKKNAICGEEHSCQASLFFPQ